MPEKSRGHDRTRIWSAIVYPESAPENWRELLDDEHIEWAESPLHELDVNPTTGEQKKPHWHIVLAFDGPKSYEQVASLLEPLNCPAPRKCASLKGAVRYFIHLDNPEKYQYSRYDIVGHGGFDVAAALVPTSASRYSMIAEMTAWCRETNCCDFSVLFDYAVAEHTDDWFPLLCDSCAYVMKAYLISRWQRRDNSAQD